MLISLYFLKKFCSIKLLRIARNKKKGKCKHLGLSSLNLLRTSEEHRKLVEGIMKRGKIGRLKIEAVGISYECPEINLDTLFQQLMPKSS
ncbi:hypothetical protein C5167_034494 [Papaver somniferum]|uniref:Uncharacterized protein n=1 Tax=Papaver somniferum TaxID=3469 RepID=A0A4Y7KH86_PAPSO|nr:uncharacterized protein LOC113299469 isoform X2 [Papaver somniferum]RZC71319.1 hypothetical protein C5167_034494 [Papaver somniferum]